MNKSDLSLNELMVLNSELRHHEKSAAVAYLLLLGGHLGAHRFYLKKTGTAITQLILFLIAMAAYFGLGFVMEYPYSTEVAIAAMVVLLAVPALILLIWIIVDLFLMSRLVREYNQSIEAELLKQLTDFRIKHAPVNKQ